MIRRIALLTLSVSLIGSAALADAPPVEKAFGNTIVSTYPDGRKGELYLEKGGAYTAKGRRGDPSSGHWSVKDDKLCLKQAKPLSVPFKFCTPFPSDMSSEWTAKAVSGEQIKVKLVEGRV